MTPDSELVLAKQRCKASALGGGAFPRIHFYETRRGEPLLLLSRKLFVQNTVVIQLIITKPMRNFLFGICEVA